MSSFCVIVGEMKYPLYIFTVLTLLLPQSVFAMSDTLRDVYDQRPDLQAVFTQEGETVAPGAAGFLMHLEDWAQQYGWQSVPELASYAPEVAPPQRLNLHADPVVDAAAWIVVDRSSGKILAANGAEKLWPIASITKLVTTDVVTKQTTALDQSWDVRNTDNVGGARLYVEDGTWFPVRELLSAALIGSANNAAYAISRVLGVPQSTFVGLMNDRVRTMGLRRTTLVDPTGIEVENQSTAREIAYLAREVFANNETVRKTTQTVRAPLQGSDGIVRTITTTNWMLYKPQYDDVWVTGGKTGFLYESEWNVVEQLRPSQYEGERELIVVVFGSASRGESFDNVQRLSKWVWSEFDWN
ncbi:hypothetical protein COV06_03370 [Candidatus Uhrbacteria bacterium CG10_big_fil_rev_8_21_14_0_10_50_16]|uniref:Peptidase S11 D-alanyl-D-alanine carboxypeptidase A N-terminal domain-containing protein n=1 Tax=Candidatus Uhrbacteria bacterium CG10_big_fil_rev_8_21_14_0_10_50_16 TaxID=1975039 RepID=A0A2H0RLN6_9BACT|nr:MAG: hypothetical protein COV06_03370 [Candidatus Uhrbacteria bacterium CG10_big_fil_rev_8_21_14_0_10_50_16]